MVCQKGYRFSAWKAIIGSRSWPNEIDLLVRNRRELHDDGHEMLELARYQDGQRMLQISPDIRSQG